ncbi:MAG: methyltransferase domain-containing protein [Candidatus Korobacteraceae bacterium]
MNPISVIMPTYNRAAKVRDSIESGCPICGHTGAQEWLRAPDRLHGRQEKYTLVRCPACSLVWLSDPPEPSEMYLHYTDAYHKLISAGGENSPCRWRGRKAGLAPHKLSGALLDLGCSSGAFLESLKDEQWKLYGVEMSAESAKLAEERSGAHVFVGDVLEAPFRRESFDVITCFDVLEHLYEPRRVMAKVGEWLKPGGIFYVLVPNIDSAEAHVFGTYWHGLELPRHLFHYSPASLRNLANKAGLSEVSLVTQRNPAVGTSLRYVWDNVFQTVGIRRTPTAYRGVPGLPWRVVRKLLRITVLRLLLAMAPLVGGGESIHAIFQKQDATL